MSERKPGWYWVKTRRAHLGKWEAALLDENKLWYLAGCDQPLSYTWPLEIGPRIPTPDERRDTVTMPSALYELLYAKRDTIDRHYQRESIPPFTWPPK